MHIKIKPTIKASNVYDVSRDESIVGSKECLAISIELCVFRCMLKQYRIMPAFIRNKASSDLIAMVTYSMLLVVINETS